VEFSGIARASLERPDFSPYEFETESGIWIRLHDMRLLSFDYQVRLSTLTMRFSYDGPHLTPPEAMGTPVAVFRFSGVQVWQWEDDVDLLETPPGHRGQVSGFEYHRPTNVFSLDTLDSRLLFSASHLAVLAEPLAVAERGS
jgi:hypothetical protein